MTLRSRDQDDQTFAAAWSAFAREDAEITAPPRLERKVMEAVRWEYARKNGARRIVRRRLLPAIGIAAAILLATWAGLPRPGRAPVSGSRAEVEATTVDDDQPAIPEALMTLAADPLREAESLQLVRIRLPRTALGALGLAVLEPDASGLVDVDVLVSDDGLPRDIRRIQPVLTNR